jgi:hypothetical protein
MGLSFCLNTEMKNISSPSAIPFGVFGPERRLASIERRRDPSPFATSPNVRARSPIRGGADSSNEIVTIIRRLIYYNSMLIMQTFTAKAPPTFWLL